MDCPFCAKVADRAFTHENDLAVAFPDGFPVSTGHTLVIPKRHEENFFRLSSAEQAAMLELVGKVQAELGKAHQPQGFNVGINIGVAAGQTVFHAHVHVIPRYVGDVPDPRGGVRGVIPGKQRY